MSLTESSHKSLKVLYWSLKKLDTTETLLGGFGFVYQAQDQQGKVVAIKKIIIQTPEALENVKREASVMVGRQA